MHRPYCILNANGIAMDEADTRFSALAVQGGRIRAVGNEADVAPFLGQGWSVCDMQGKTVLPGFIDTHQHLGLTGQVMRGLDCAPVTSFEELFDLIAAGRAKAAPGEWVLGYTLSDQALAEGRMPLARELDKVCPDHPLMLSHSCMHLCSLNTLAVEMLTLRPGIPGVDVDGAGPTGVVRDPAALTHVYSRVCALIPDEHKLEGFRMAADAALARGVTSLHCLEGGDYGPGETELLLDNLDIVPQHCLVWNQSMDLEAPRRLGLPRIGGCICADGAIDAYTAALFEPYNDQPDNYGDLNYPRERMEGFVMEAHRRDLQIAVHCETDRAIEQVLRAMEKALAAHPKADHRHRIEHVELPTPNQLERMARAGIIASMQPAFLPYLVDMEWYERMFGARLRWLHPYATMRDAGVRMCGGSDSPVTPVWPLVGIQAAMTHPIEEERLDLRSALRMFTLDAAYAGFEEHERGSIETGKRADMVVLDEDPFSLPPEVVGRLGVVHTYIAGEPVESPRDGPGMGS